MHLLDYLNPEGPPTALFEMGNSPGKETDMSGMSQYAAQHALDKVNEALGADMLRRAFVDETVALVKRERDDAEAALLAILAHADALSEPRSDMEQEIGRNAVRIASAWRNARRG